LHMSRVFRTALKRLARTECGQADTATSEAELRISCSQV
jgi:hypothetical protein